MSCQNSLVTISTVWGISISEVFVRVAVVAEVTR